LLETRMGRQNKGKSRDGGVLSGGRRQLILLVAVDQPRDLGAAAPRLGRLGPCAGRPANRCDGSMRVVYPTISSMGFGNNVLTLAKAHLIAESCALQYQRPIWPRTEHVPGERHGYGYYFPWTVRDRLWVTVFSSLYRVQRKLSVPPWPPCVFFRREDYERTRQLDVGEACRAHLAESGLDDPTKSVIVTTNGMWGGYAGIQRARPWLEQLLLSHGETRRRFQE